MTTTARAVAHGAITVVNAIPTGRGAAVGIDMPFEAEARYDATATDVQVAMEGREAEDPALVRHTVDVVSSAAGIPFTGAVTTRTPIPVARGLKSSSCCANAVAIATASALGHPFEADDLLAWSVEASRRAGVTRTGALDDAAASLLGGLVVTDNMRGTVLVRRELEPMHVRIWVPERRRYTADVGDRLIAARAACARAHARALEGAWPDALTLNGLACSAALDEPLGIAAAAHAAGAMAAGLTGTGPAVAAVSSAEHVDAIEACWAPYDGVVLRSTTTNEAWQVSV